MPRRAGYEADDFLAAAAAAEERRGGTVLVASGDRDTFQLASEQTTILYPVRAGEMARIGPAEVRERYGVEPEQVPDFIALARRPVRQAARRAAASARPAPRALAADTARWKQALKAGRFAAHAERAAAVPLDRHHGPQGAAAAPRTIRRRPGARRPRWRENGSSTSWPTGSKSSPRHADTLQYSPMLGLFAGGRPARFPSDSNRHEPEMRSILYIILVVLDIYIWLLIAAAVLSWLVAFNVINTRNQFVAMVGDFLYRITEPVLRPIRNMLPSLGGIDLSPVVADPDHHPDQGRHRPLHLSERAPVHDPEKWVPVFGKDHAQMT